MALPEDAALRRRLARAARLAENGRAADAAQALGRLAEAIGESDAFVRVEPQSRTLRSAKAEVQRLIGALPPAGRAAYEAAFGPPARRMLDESPADPAVIRRVASLYVHTAAGADALRRLAAVYRDQGAFAEAAVCLERLRAIRPGGAKNVEPSLSLELAACRLRCGDREGAQAVLTAVSGEASPGVVIGGEAIAELPSVAKMTELLAGTDAVGLGITPHPADAEAVAEAAGDPLLAPRWSVETPEFATAEAIGRRLGAFAPAFVPTVIGEQVFRPTGDGFAVHDLATGRQLWAYPSTASSVASEAVWTELAKGRLSTDGQAVFLVEGEDRASAAPPSVVRAQFAQQGGFLQIAQGAFAVNQVAFLANDDTYVGPVLGPSTNVLTALDVRRPRQGNRLWRVGGVSGGAEPRLAGYFFLGPPLAAHGRLYAIAEREQAVRLVVLDGTTGRLDWSLDLGRAEVPVTADPQRRRIGAMPTLTRGILLCPSAGGSVVAVDLAGRSLIWGFRFRRSSPPAWSDAEGFSQPQPTALGWTDGTIQVAGGRAVLTPPEAEELYCLDLATGQTLWKRGREDGAFAVVGDQRVIVIGRAKAILLNVRDGSPVRTSIGYTGDVVPSGMGYFFEGSYVQPFSDGSLMRISLGDGSAVSVKSKRGVGLGNLVWREGMMLSLGTGFLRAFDDQERISRQVAEVLGTDSNDVGALLRQADLHSESGNYAEAISDSRLAYEREPGPVTKNRLVAALLDGLRYGLPEAAEYDAELDRLAEAD